MTDETMDVNEDATEATDAEATAPEVVEEPVAEADAADELTAEPEVEAPVAEVEPEAEPAPAAEAEAEVEAEAAPEPAEAAAAAEPTVDVEPEAEAEASEGAAVPAKKKRKRVPRSERRQRSKPKRETPAERKPITRLPKPEHARGRRQERQGTVVSAASDKTIVVRVDVVKLHPMYKKVIRRSTRFHAHDEENQAKVGDVVRIVETRPLSKLKRWRLREIVEEAK